MEPSDADRAKFAAYAKACLASLLREADKARDRLDDEWHAHYPQGIVDDVSKEAHMRWQDRRSGYVRMMGKIRVRGGE